MNTAAVQEGSDGLFKILFQNLHQGENAGFFCMGQVVFRARLKAVEERNISASTRNKTLVVYLATGYFPVIST
jgi:hypothetical protein